MPFLRSCRALLIPLLLTASVSGGTDNAAPRFARAFELAPEEGVFAYARISPDGRFLAYASEYARGRGATTRTVTVVDLSTKQILFTEPGIDAYWSDDGKRMIYLSFEDRRSSVSIRHHDTGQITRNVAPVSLGDYFSWGVREKKNLILTINSNYYYLDGDEAILPAATVSPCPGMGRGERPLLSRDGKRITTFVRGTVVVRDLTGCDFILDTGIQGQKADFSWDGRHIAFHALKANGTEYEIKVVDIQKKTVRTLAPPGGGSSYFPSWTRDGRISFRYDGPDYRGFMFAHDVLSAPVRPLPATSQQVPARRTWVDIFPETPLPRQPVNLVLIWGTWSAHSPVALTDLQQARAFFARAAMPVGVWTATDPGSLQPDIDRLLERNDIDLPRIPLASQRFLLTEARNQIPTTLLFREGELIDRRLGAQSFEQLRDWVSALQER
jgi:hypothetical protein